MVQPCTNGGLKRRIRVELRALCTDLDVCASTPMCLSDKVDFLVMKVRVNAQCFTFYASYEAAQSVSSLVFVESINPTAVFNFTHYV